MPNKRRKRSSKEWAAIHANKSKPHITFNDKKESKKKIVGTNHTKNVSSNRLSDDVKKLKLQILKNNLKRSATKKQIVKKITPNTLEANINPVPEFINFKATWELK